MTQSLAQLQADWRDRAAQPNLATGDDEVYVDGFDSALVICADALSPHVEREAAAQAKSLADERRIQELEAALRRTLDWLASHPGEGTMRKGGPYEQARAALGDVTATKEQDK